MGGLIHHLSIAIICFLIIYVIFRKVNCSLAIFLGNFLPDSIEFLCAGILIGSFNPALVLNSALWLSMERNQFIQALWIVFPSLFLLPYLLLRPRLKLFKLGFEDFIAMMLLGSIVHTATDMVVKEAGILV
jgi:hypothetical protein